MPKLTVSELDRELRSKNLRPIYFIYGPEGYLANTAVARIKKFSGVEAERFSAKDKTAADIVSSAETLPMWAQSRLIIVSEADSIKDGDAFAKYFKKPSKTTTLVFLAGKADGRTKFVQLCTEFAAAVECKGLYDDKIPDWVRMESQERGKAMSMEAAACMAELVGNNLGELSGAIDKVILYIGNKPVIDTEDVETVLTETGRKNVFEFADAVGGKKLPDAVRILKRLAEFGENEVMILTMLARHWRLLTKTKEFIAGGRGGYDKFALAKILAVNPFFVDNYVRQAKFFTVGELKSGFKKLYTADKMLKSSKLPKRNILENCVRELV